MGPYVLLCQTQTEHATMPRPVQFSAIVSVEIFSSPHSSHRRIGSAIDFFAKLGVCCVLRVADGLFAPCGSNTTAG
jgi:hypothetical protein